MLMKTTRESRQRQPRLRSFRDVDALIHELGGVDGVTQWARASDANMATFYKMYFTLMLKEERPKPPNGEGE